MRYIDVTGKTESEAIEKALRQLGLDRDDVSVEILERAKSGFLGLGASPAKVRVTYEDPAEEIPAAPAVEEKPVKKEAVREEVKAEKSEKREAPKQEKKPQQEKKSRRGERRAVAEVSKTAEKVNMESEADDAKSQQIRAFLTGLMEHLDSKAQVKVYLVEKDRYKVYLEGDKLGQLIGRRGETLDSIQQLTNYSVNRGSDKRVRVHVDAENYREKREQSLQNLALKVAAKVVKYRKNVTLEPMNAYERHVIHTALQDVNHVTTYSMGTEPNRRVVVAYER